MLLLLFASCSLHQHSVALDQVLALQLFKADVDLEHREALLQIAVVNKSSEAVEFCFLDGGLSISVVKPGTDQLFPLVMSGAVMDAWCYNRTVLRAGERLLLERKVDLPPFVDHDASFGASVRVHVPPERLRPRSGETVFALRLAPES